MSKTITAAAEPSEAQMQMMSEANIQKMLDNARAEGVASAKGQIDEARSEGIMVGRAEATARIKEIVTNPEAEHREQQALVLALDTTMTAEDAIKVLAASPKAARSTSIADRAAQETELGAEPPASRLGNAERVVAGWSKAITQANARFG